MTKSAPSHAGPKSSPDSGWTANLALDFVTIDGRTRLRRRAGHGPLVVQKPFWPDGETCHIYLIHPPGGVVGGDRITVSLRIGEQSRALVTAPGATKFYRSNGRTASVLQTINVEAGAAFEWLPTEQLVFNAAKAQVQTDFLLETGARLIAMDFVALGRPASGESFAQGCFCSRLNVSVAKHGVRRKVVSERLVLDADAAIHQIPAGLGGALVMGTLIATPVAPSTLETLRRAAPDADLTMKNDLLQARCLGQGVESVQLTLRRLWAALRPAVIGKSAVPPRIWST